MSMLNKDTKDYYHLCDIRVGETVFYCMCDLDEDLITFYEELMRKNREFQRVHIVFLATVNVDIRLNTTVCSVLHNVFEGVCVCVCIKARGSATERQPCTELSVPVVISAQSLWLRRRLQRAAGEETLLLYLSPCSSPLPLISLSLFSFFLPLLRLFLIVLLCPSA